MQLRASSLPFTAASAGGQAAAAGGLAAGSSDSAAAGDTATDAAASSGASAAAGASSASSAASPPVWPPPDESNLPAGLEPLPNPATWTGGLISRSMMAELVDEGYPSNYVSEWQRACDYYTLRSGGDGGGGGGGGGGDGGPLPASSGDPAGDPGPAPTAKEYADWEAIYQIEALEAVRGG